jgi:hypothetical protein
MGKDLELGRQENDIFTLQDNEQFSLGVMRLAGIPKIPGLNLDDGTRYSNT